MNCKLCAGWGVFLWQRSRHARGEWHLQSLVLRCSNQVCTNSTHNKQQWIHGFWNLENTQIYTVISVTTITSNVPAVQVGLLQCSTPNPHLQAAPRGRWRVGGHVPKAMKSSRVMRLCSTESAGKGWQTDRQTRSTHTHTIRPLHDELMMSICFGISWIDLACPQIPWIT